MEGKNLSLKEIEILKRELKIDLDNKVAMRIQRFQKETRLKVHGYKVALDIISPLPLNEADIARSTIELGIRL